MFVMHWTCLSLVAIRRILEDDMDVRNCAHEAVNSLAGEDDTGNAQALVGAQRINETLEDAKDCLHRIYIVLSKSRETENLEEVRGILRNRVLLSEISKLENINIHNEAGHLENVDHWISATQYSVAHHITSQIPGVPNDFDPLVPFSHLVEHVRDPRKLQFIRPGQILRSLCSVGTTLRNVLKGQGDVEAYKQVQKDLGQLFLGVVLRDGNEVLRQLWRLQDLRHGCGFGFTVELFFISLSQLLSTSSSNNSHSSLYTGTFRAITSDWSKHQNSHGTRRLLLDVALSHRFMFQDGYPDYIVNEYLDLMGNFFKGQDGYIDEAVQQLGSFKSYTNAPFWHRLLNVLISARAA
ncbi:hypothetical protein BGY98DRAFT_965708 [Russula aff. rugulosa BPL654]|nr:hypothetical protein BGY98DRAFT_965708 [Russula aff. rugulosa BPL654]